MRTIRQPSVFRHRGPALLPLCAALALGCQGMVNVGPSGGGGTSVGAGTGGTGTTGTGGGGTPNGGTGVPGTGGTSGPAAACTGASDARLVVAPQRFLRLTMNETLNTIRYLIDSNEATMLVSSGMIGQGTDDNVEVARQFPPLQQKTIIGAEYTRLDQFAQHVRDYVLANYATLTMALAGCSAVTDACATTYLNRLAARAYRRNLTAVEQTRFTALYNRLKSHVINGYQVTSTVQEATSNAVYALLSSPQMLWRSEIGNAAMASTSPAGIPLTDAELATQVSFFLTDQPPDDMLLMAANGNTLRTNLGTHVTRLLGTQPAKDWLRTIIETYYLINQLPTVVIDSAKFPIFSAGLLADMRIEEQKFLDNALWSGNLTDLLLSRTTFLNTGLASAIYNVPAPTGATATNFAQATLPMDKRAGFLTNAAFITSRGRSDGRGMVVPRGKAIAAAVLCMPPPSPPDTIMGAITAAKAAFDTQTGQQQVASRNAIPLCASCHINFDPYGLVLENYDTLGRWRDTDPDLAGMPVIDASTNLPAALGGERVTNAVDLAQKLAASPAFTNCMARTMLQYALVDLDTAPVELPLLPETAGCASADVASKYNNATSKTFTELVRATTATPAFALRRAVP